MEATASANANGSSLSSSRSPTPAPLVQPDHFFGSEGTPLPPSPNSDGRTWLEPEDDPLAHRGIPVFKPTMDEFQDFEGYMKKIECWGLRSGIVKVIPPKEWVDALPSTKDQLRPVKIRTPIEQHMLGRGGLFRQENVEKRRVMSVREWAELCEKEEFRAPGVEDVGLHGRGAYVKTRSKRSKMSAASTKVESAEPEDLSAKVKEEEGEDDNDEAQETPDGLPAPLSPPTSAGLPQTPVSTNADDLVHHPASFDPSCSDDQAPGDVDMMAHDDKDVSEKKQVAKKRGAQSREVREAERAAKDAAFLETFEPHKDWLPSCTKADDYTVEFCQKLERQFWRNCGLGKPAWYGADTQGSVFTDETTAWNVGHLPSFLSRILPSSSKGLPGVNTPYLYFGMWRATFAWHVEDMDLFSINYIHFGAPKFWYAMPQGRGTALESTMKGYFPKDISQCPQFLRHKSFLASPTLLAQSSCRPNFLVQRAQEFVITYPRGYHAGFNLGFNCAESVNFALESWVELGRKAKACQCISDSVRIDVDQLLLDREAECLNSQSPEPERRRPSSKRKALEGEEPRAKRKRPKTKPEVLVSTPAPGPSASRVTLKLGPRPPEDIFPCCLCTSPSRDGLFPVQDPPVGRRELPESLSSLASEAWLAHEECAKVVPETWVDEVEVGTSLEKRVFGVDAIVRDRWNLKCAACSKARHKAHGAPIQCTKGKCAKSFHVGCARDGGPSGIVYSIMREVEKEVILVYPQPNPLPPPQHITPTLDGVPMDLDAAGSQLEMQQVEPQVLKIIKKYDVELLCLQHNPAVAAAKKASKQDRIKAELAALPPMSRIKIRVSSGVFEVSLLRIVEDTGSVEVLWDRGIKREFKWGSVIFGQTEGQTVMQKPSEPAPELPHTSMQVTTYPSVSAAAASSAMSSQATSATAHLPAHYALPHQQYHPTTNEFGSGAWSYHARYEISQPHQAQLPQMSHGYATFYSQPAYRQSGNSTYQASNSTQVQWQQPYTGGKSQNVQGSSQ
ncbi:JmjC-domain-containing protein [Rhizopogon vinicolor AM-OR11-026]|uniref:[histone H3]-trimethyl-L-lysine(9) demethylase n=1 Tax=Rhizopogon vinicolor AM-OR11-026 TaxID=1314800 RepID=A0A1B7NAA7_9AGAM|nr:JmjC-domain-containing protein [Rhizopogon vinicolor AM-OR11-026]